MILRFKLYCYAAAGAAASSAYCCPPFVDASFAVVVPPASSSTTTTAGVAARRRTTTTSSPLRRDMSLNPDWDNADFLSSLGGSKDQMDDANDAYYRQSENRAAMDAGSDNSGSCLLPRRPPPTRDIPPPPPPPPPQQQQQQLQPPPQQRRQQFYDANGNPVSVPMVYDAHGNLVPFDPVIPAVLPPPPPPHPRGGGGHYAPSLEFLDAAPLPPKTKGADVPRPVGYNPDAFAMSNTADVYFAQLKQDSKVRKLARMSGDLETANRVFADESVKRIGESWQANPYTKELSFCSFVRSKNIAEARAEIEGAVRMQIESDYYAEDGSGSTNVVSYREKLARMKKSKKTDVGATTTTTISPPASSAPPRGGSEASTSPVGAASSPLTIPAPTAVAAAAAPSSFGAAPAVVAAATDEEDVRRRVRTLQGLLLKHRGGPGFGAGRLKAPEARRLEETLAEVTGILRSELAAATGGGEGDGRGAASAPASSGMGTASAAPTLPARAAATAAASPSPPTAVATAGDPLAGSVACVEAVLRMYKETSDPAEREAMIVPLREALMAAASASNRVIAETELRAHRSAMEAGPAAAFASMGGDGVGATAAAARPMMGFPTAYAATDPREEDEGIASTPAAMAAGDDGRAANDRTLEDVYSALLNARGDGGKLGLGNISGNEANDLSDKLVAMRGWAYDGLAKYCCLQYSEEVAPRPHALVEDLGIDDLVGKGASRETKKKKKSKVVRNNKSNVKKEQVKQDKPTIPSVDDYKRQHSMILSKLHEEVQLRLKDIRTRLNALDLDHQQPKSKNTGIKKSTPTKEGPDDQMLLRESGVGGKAGKAYFVVQVGEVQNLYKTTKTSALASPMHGQSGLPTLDLHGCTRVRAVVKLNKSLKVWVDTAMRGYDPFVITAVIVCGCGSQELSETVQEWIKSTSQVRNAPKNHLLKDY
ncbi:hypothetical protein ACHAW5_007916 [Stephanodiscus triporus]|uniref:Uncharacterized protein n=1 Tax=Stephanodiscus triporus TaxID=2934178 RepID=A0ABD3MXR2_9STRA